MSVTTAQDAVAALLLASHQGTVEVTATSVHRDERDSRILSLDDVARASFAENAQRAGGDLSRKSAVPYEPTYKPEISTEYEVAAATDFPAVVAAVADLTPTSALAPFPVGDTQFRRRLAYSTVILTREAQRIYLFRRFTRTSELQSKKGTFLFFRHDQFVAPEEVAFHFDGGVDAVVVDNVLLITNKTSFRTVFEAMTAVFEKAGQAADAVHAKLPIKNFDAFKAAVQSQPALADKVIAVTKQPYFAQLTIDDVEATNAQFGFGVPIVEEDGTKLLEFRTGPAERWRLLRLLDDDALTSTMTSRRYVANSKRASA